MPFTTLHDPNGHHFHPHIGMRKIKSILAIFVGFCLWQTLRLLLPELDHAAQVARGICRAVNLLYLATGRGGENLPVCFTVPDMSRFAWEQLQGAWPGSRGVCMELLGPFKTALNDFQLKVKVC